MTSPLNPAWAQLPVKYATLELFTNTPCPICGSQNPGLFDRLENFEDEYHIISWYPGKPYSSCIFYQANIAENTTRFQHYPGVVGTPTVVINGLELRSAGSVSNTILEGVTGQESWLSVEVQETTGSTRTVDLTLRDHVGGSLSEGILFAAIVEREIMDNAPNGETVHYNVFRKFLTDASGEEVDLSSGEESRSYEYTVDLEWQAEEVYVIAWLMDPETKEIYNSGTRFDELLSSIKDPDAEPLDIFPNPVSSEVRISLPDDLSSATVRIYDINGRTIHDEVVTGLQSIRIDSKNWTAGHYIASVRAGDRVLIGRFQVSH